MPSPAWLVNNARRSRTPLLALAAITAACIAPASAGAAAFTAPLESVAPMPVISRGVPAYTNDDCDGGYPAKYANDAKYTNRWTTCKTAVSATNRKWLAYDLSGVSASQRGKVVITWVNDPVTGPYDHTLTGGPGYNTPAAYTLETNPATGGGAAPTSGWTAVATVTGNTFNARQHLVDLAGANWVRLVATASDGSAGNMGIALNMD